METLGPFQSTRTCPGGGSVTYTWTVRTTIETIEYRTIRPRFNAWGWPCVPLVEFRRVEVPVSSVQTYSGYECPGECCSLTDTLITTSTGPEYVLQDSTSMTAIRCPNGSLGTRTTRILSFARDLTETIHEVYGATSACPGTPCVDREYPGATTVLLTTSVTRVFDDCH